MRRRSWSSPTAASISSAPTIPARRRSCAAAALVDYMIDDARRSGFRIIPICPYVRARYEKHPEWADVMTVAPGEKPVIRL